MGEGHLVFIPLFFIVNAPKNSPKKISFHKTPTGGGHRFMKLFRKIDFFKMMASLNEYFHVTHFSQILIIVTYTFAI